MISRRIAQGLASVIALASVLRSGRVLAEEKPSTEPTLTSIFPMVGQGGSTVKADFRGTNLEGVFAVWSEASEIRGVIGTVEAIPDEAKKEQKTFRAGVQLNIAAVRKNRTCSLRLITPRGISNPVSFEVTREAVTVESDSPHGTSSDAAPIRLPAIVSGRIRKPGELDYYAFDISRGQELTLGVAAKEEKAAVLGVPPDFQPQLNLYESGGSWLDPLQNNWLGSGSADTPLTYRFERPGRYLIQVGGILGKGSPDYVYRLSVGPSQHSITRVDPSAPELAEPEAIESMTTRAGWQERSFTRPITRTWNEAVRSRTLEPSSGDDMAAVSVAADAGQTSAQGGSPHAVAVNQPKLPLPAPATELKETEPNEKLEQALTLPIPVIISGTIGRVGDVDTFRFKAAKGQRLAFEVETPDMAPPRFNPQFSILDADGREILNNVRKRIYTLRREAPSMTVPAFFEGIQPKVVITFAAEGDYYLRIRGLTSRTGGPNCAYRLMAREQVPHIGETSVKEDHVNLRQGEAKALTIIADQEEGFEGELALSVDNLPPGVRAFPATEGAVKEPDGYETQHKENLDPRTRKVTLLLSADAAAAPITKPSLIRIQGAPVVNGKLGRQFTIVEIPLMVVAPMPKKSPGLTARIQLAAQVRQN